MGDGRTKKALLLLLLKKLANLPGRCNGEKMSQETHKVKSHWYCGWVPSAGLDDVGRNDEV